MVRLFDRFRITADGGTANGITAAPFVLSVSKDEWRDAWTRGLAGKLFIL